MKKDKYKHLTKFEIFLIKIWAMRIHRSGIRVVMRVYSPTFWIYFALAMIISVVMDLVISAQTFWKNYKD